MEKGSGYAHSLMLSVHGVVRRLAHPAGTVQPRVTIDPGTVLFGCHVPEQEGGPLDAMHV